MVFYMSDDEKGIYSYLLEKYGDPSADFTRERARLEGAVNNQMTMLEEQVDHEVQALEELSVRLMAIGA